MKAIAIGFLLVLLLAIDGNPVTALAVGIVTAFLLWQVDDLRTRVRGLEQPASATAPAAIPPPAPPPTAAPSVSYWGQPKQAEPIGAAAEAGEAPDWWPHWRIPALNELEGLLAGRGLAVVGGIALTLGVIFFLGLAFSRGWIGPEGRVAIGLIAGSLFFALGAWLLVRGREVVAHVMVAVGLGAITLSLFAATRLYGFIPGELGVGASLVVAAVTALLAIRSSSQLMALFGLVAVLAAPPVMGASATLVTIAFLGVALAGTTAIALFRSWRWLPPVAFVLAAPQLVDYILGSPMVAIALPALVAFWLLHAIAAGGEELLENRGRLSETSATLLVANAAFLVWGGFELLDGALEPTRGLFLLGVTVAHLLLALAFLLRDERHPFGMLAAGTGIAALTLAAPVQLGAPIVPMAWAAEAVALTWIYVERRHGYSGIAAVVLGAMAAAHLLTVEYPIDVVFVSATAGIPFVNENGAALAFVVAAAIVAIGLVAERAVRLSIAAVAVALVVLAARFELDGAALICLLTAVTVACLLVEKRWLRIRLLPERNVWGATDAGDRALYLAATLAALHATWTTLVEHLPPPAVLDGLRGVVMQPWTVPFGNEATLVAAILVAGALAGAFLADDLRWRAYGVAAAAFVVAYLVPTQAGPGFTVAVWSLLAVVLALSSARWTPRLRFTPHALVGAAVVEALAVAAPPTELVVRATAMSEFPLFNEASLAAAALTLAFAVGARLTRHDREALAAGALAAVFGVYLISIGTVDLFQVRLGGPIALEELQKQAQVALSVVWAVIGVASLVYGLARESPYARGFGLALLSMTTLKVFIVDLAALDVAYRVLSFVALGILLLGAAYLYARLQPRSQSASR